MHSPIMYQNEHEQLLVEPRAYDLDVSEFINFLEEGKHEFNKK